jgi:hypothetical protein
VPANPTWFQELTEIVAALEALPSPWIDRSVFETLFRVKRRRAHQLMEQFGAVLVGKRYLIERDRLVKALSRVRDGDRFGREIRRRDRFEILVEQLRKDQAARRVVIPGARATVPDLGLPSSVTLREGLLEIRFRGAEDLLGQLYQLAQAIAADYERYAAELGATPRDLENSQAEVS